MDPGDPDHHDPTHINEIINQLAEASDPSDLRALLNEHPEVLTDSVEHALEATLQELAAAGDMQTLRTARFIAHLLTSCRIVGVDTFTNALQQATTNGPDAVDTEKLNRYLHQALAEYLQTGGLDVLTSLTDAVAYAYVVVPVGSFQAEFSGVLGVALRRCFMTTGDEYALTRAVRALRIAVANSDERSPAHVSHLTNLGNALRTSASVQDSQELLAESVDVHRTALGIASLEERPQVAANLGAALIDLYTQTKGGAPLDEAVDVLQGVHGLPAEESRLGRLILSNLALALRHRFDLAGNTADLCQAVEAGSEAVAAVPPNDPETGDLRKQLAADLRLRFALLGDDTDLERSIILLRDLLAEAADAVPGDAHADTGATAAHVELAAALDLRYRLTGDREDLHEEQELLEAALAASRGDNVRRGQNLNNLGMAYRTQSENSGNLDPDEPLLSKAIRCFEEAIEVLSAHGEPVHLVQGNLAMALVMRHRRAGDRRDLDRAIELEEAALPATPRGSSDHSLRLSELASALGLVSQLDESAESASRAVALMEEAVLAFGDSPLRFAAVHNLAAALVRRNHLTDDPADLDRGLALLATNASEAVQISPTMAVRSAMDLGRLEGQRNRWDEAARAYTIALAAARRLVEAQLRWTDANDTVRTVRFLPQVAAYAHARTGNAKAAVEAVELGRGYLLHNMLDRRLAELRDLDASGHADLVDEYERAADGLRFLDTALADHPSAAPARADLVREIRDARRGLTDVIERIRAIPGFNSFAAAPGGVPIAPPVSVVYIVAADPSGVVLIRGPGQQAEDSLIVECPELGLVNVFERTRDFLVRTASAASRSSEWEQILDELTRWLWSVAMGTVTQTLRPGEQVVLVPVGLLSLLPWHAAWRPDAERGRVYALDELRISYAPTARLVANSAPSLRPDAEPSLLVVEAPEPVGAPDLPMARPEADAASSWFTDVTRLRGGHATREGALQHLGQHEVAHLICHGFVALQHPLDSFLLMAGDAPLTLRDILARPHDALSLVILSACDTGSYSFDNVDDVFSLASGFLAGGVSEAIASLWPVPDASTALLMSATYRFWRGDGNLPAEALRRAQQWVRDSTNEEKLRTYPDLFGAPVRNLPPAARRTWGRGRAHSSPIHWAAFTHHGLTDGLNPA